METLSLCLINQAIFHGDVLGSGGRDGQRMRNVINSKINLPDRREEEVRRRDRLEVMDDGRTMLRGG
jgi:hypothetical protein